MTAASIKKDVTCNFELKPVFGEGREDRFKWIKKIFTDVIQPLFHYSCNSLEEIERSRSLKCRVLLVNKDFLGALVYNTLPTNIYKKHGIPNCLEIEWFYCQEGIPSYDKVMRFLLDYALVQVKIQKASSLCIRVARNSRKIFDFVKSQRFFKVEIQEKSYFLMTNELMRSEIQTESFYEKKCFEGISHTGKIGESKKRKLEDGPEMSQSDQKRQRNEQIGTPNAIPGRGFLVKDVIKECPIKYEYFAKIKSGEKTVEGRINSGMFRWLKEGQLLRFKNQNLNVLCKITSIKSYKTFADMLAKEGVKSCLPNITSLERAISIYRNIPGYPEKERKFGVLAIHIKLVT